MKKILDFIRHCLGWVYNGVLEKFFWIFPINSQKIICSSFFGQGYSDNPKYIVEELHKRAPEYKILWIVNDKNESSLPEWIKKVKHHSFSELYNLATSKLWIDNCRKHFALKRRRNQQYIMTWHGSPALKKVEGDASEKIPASYMKCAVRDTQNATMFISNGKWCTELYRRAFWYNGEILEYGLPRSDILLNMSIEKENEIRLFLNIPEDANIAIYAPTFRIDFSKKAYNIDLLKLRDVLVKRFGGEWYILLRLHPSLNLRGMHMDSSFDFTREVTAYSDMCELLAISDFLITDYSSTMFDMAHTNKPVVLLATDIDDYMNDRGTYFTFDELPFPLAQNMSELTDIIINWDNERYVKNVRRFMLDIGIAESGFAAEKVVNRIISEL